MSQQVLGAAKIRRVVVRLMIFPLRRVWRSCVVQAVQLPFLLLVAPVLSAQTASAPPAASPEKPAARQALTPAGTILFVGNSFLYGQGSPIRFYRAHTVTDLNGDGVGGVPALFKAFTAQAGFDYAVSLETVGGSGLDLHVQRAEPGRLVCRDSVC